LPPPYTLSSTHRQLLRQAYDDVLEAFATKHVANIINNGFGFTEYELDSALARADQTPYEALFEGAQNSEMNNMQHLWSMFVDTRKTWQKLQQEKNEKAKL
jgi:acyl-CoA oxidase